MPSTINKNPDINTRSTPHEDAANNTQNTSENPPASNNSPPPLDTSHSLTAANTVPATPLANSLPSSLSRLPQDVFVNISTFLNEDARNQARLVNNTWAKLLPPSVLASEKWLENNPNPPPNIHKLKITKEETLKAFLDISKDKSLSVAHLDLSEFRSSRKFDGLIKDCLGMPLHDEKFLQLLSKIPWLQSLNLAFNRHKDPHPDKISIIQISGIYQLRTVCQDLTTINLSGNTIEDIDANTALNGLRGQVFSRVTYLNLSNISLTPSALNNLLPFFPNLTHLNLSNTYLTPSALNNLLPFFPNLTHLNLSNTYLTPSALNNLLPFFTHLTHLDLSENQDLHKNEFIPIPGVHLSNLIFLKIGFANYSQEYYFTKKNYYIDNVKQFIARCPQLETLILDGYEYNLPDNPHKTFKTEINNLLLMTIQSLPNLKNLELNFQENYTNMGLRSLETYIHFTEELCANLQKLQKLHLSNGQPADLMQFLAAGYFSNTQISGRAINVLRTHRTFQAKTLNQAGIANLQKYCAQKDLSQTGPSSTKKITNFSYGFETIILSRSNVTAEILNVFLPSCSQLTKLCLDNCPDLDLNRLLSAPKTLQILGKLLELGLSFSTSQLETIEKFIMASNKLSVLSLTAMSDTEKKINLEELVSWLDHSQGKELNSRLANLYILNFADFSIQDIADFSHFLDAIDELSSATGTRPLSWVQGSFYLATDIPENKLRQLIKDRMGTSIKISESTDEQPLRKYAIQIDMKKRPVIYTLKGVFILPTTVDTINLSNAIITAEVLNTFLPSYLNLTTLYLDNCPKLDLNQLASNPKTLEIFGNLSTLKLSFRTSDLEGLTKLIVAGNKLRELSLTTMSDTEKKINLEELVSWLDHSQGKELNNRLANLNKLTFLDFFIKDLADFTHFLDAIDRLRSTTKTRPLSLVQGSFYSATDIPENKLRKIVEDRLGTSIHVSFEFPENKTIIRKYHIAIDMTKRPGTDPLEDGIYSPDHS